MDDQLRDFIHYLLVEKGLAKNTIVSYERDLKSYLKYLKSEEKISSLESVQRTQIVQFLGFLKNRANPQNLGPAYSLFKGLSPISAP